MASRKAMHLLLLKTGVKAHKVAAFNIFRTSVVTSTNFETFLGETIQMRSDLWRRQCSLFLANNKISIDFAGRRHEAARNTRRYEIVNYMVQFIRARCAGLVVRRSQHGADGLNFGVFLLHSSPIKTAAELVVALNLLASTYVTSSPQQTELIAAAPQSDFPSLIDGDDREENTVTFLLGFLYFLNHHADAAIGIAASTTAPLQLLDYGNCKFLYYYYYYYNILFSLISFHSPPKIVLYDSCGKYDDCSEVLIRYDSRDASSFADTVREFGPWIDSKRNYPSEAKRSLLPTRTIRKTTLYRKMSIGKQQQPTNKSKTNVGRRRKPIAN